MPQHWAQEAGDKHPLPDGTWCKNTATHNILYWDQKHFQKLVLHCSSTNTPSSTRPLCLKLIKPSPQCLKHLRLPTSAESMSFSTLGEGPLPQKAHLIPWIACHVKSLLPRRISSLINSRSQSMRESQRTTKLSKRQTYLLHLPTTSLIQASLAAAPSLLTPLLFSMKTRNSSLPLSTIWPS